MANYSTLKTAIQSVIKTNGNNEITGALLQQSLLSMINSLGAGYQFMGVATPTTNPGTPDQRIFYIAKQGGTYTNFNNMSVSTLAILYYDTQWRKNEIEKFGFVEKITDLQLSGIKRNLIKEYHGWVRYSDGRRFETSGNAYSAILPLNGEKKIDVFVGKDGGLSVAFAAIAFYSDETPSTSSYISASSVQYQTGVDWYSATIPDNAKIAIITYTHDEGYIVFTDGSYIEYVDNKIEGVKNEINNLLTRAKFVKNAWVRYSDGLIAESAGARLFRLNKADIGQATKITAKIAPNNTVFAAIAFYSGEPSEATYMQSISVVSNYPDTEDSVYEINVPSENWVCALFSDQYAIQPNPEIYANATPSGVSSEYVDNKIEGVKNDVYDRFLPLKNIFDFKPLYHHLNQELENPTIPAQSLLDVAFAKQLGFDMIEANPHPCSDGVILCKHGIAGKLGNGLIFADGSTLNASTTFDSVTSTQIRNDVSYNSIIEKYKGGHIPTLDEFAAECKKYQLRIKLTWIPGILDILRKYLTDDMIWITATIRPSGFRGCIEYICNSPSDIDASIAVCKIIGAPVNIVIASGTEGQYTDAQITELVTKAHNNGFTVGMVYPTSNTLAKYLPMGIDVFGSTSGNTNFIDIGNEININRLADTKISYWGGSSYDSTNDIINMPVDSTIYVPENIPIILGQCGIKVRFKGKIEIVVGNEGGYYRGLTAESNDIGEAYLNLAIMATDRYPTHDKWVNITAKEQSTIYSLILAGSKL